MCGYFCIGFINFMLKEKTLTDFTNIFSSNHFLKKVDIILNYFMTNVQKWLNAIPLSVAVYTQI